MFTVEQLGVWCEDGIESLMVRDMRIDNRSLSLGTGIAVPLEVFQLMCRELDASDIVCEVGMYIMLEIENVSEKPVHFGAVLFGHEPTERKKVA